MATLKAGAQAPDFHLPDLTGHRHSLAKLRSHGPVLVAFFKVGCPTCQYTFPFLQRLRERTPEDALRLVGVSQDTAEKTEFFNTEFGVRFPTLVDTADYTVSNAYGLTHVPSLFLIEPDGRAALASIGFVKADLETLAKRFAGQELFHRDEKIEAFRAG